MLVTDLRAMTLDMCQGSVYSQGINVYKVLMFLLSCPHTHESEHCARRACLDGVMLVWQGMTLSKPILPCTATLACLCCRGTFTVPQALSTCNPRPAPPVPPCKRVVMKSACATQLVSADRKLGGDQCAATPEKPKWWEERVGCRVGNRASGTCCGRDLSTTRTWHVS